MGSLKVPALVANITDNPATALRPAGRLTHDPLEGALAIHDGVTPGGDRINRFKRTAAGGVGAVELPTKRVMASYEVTPEQFGAKGDGIANDAPAIQAALDHIKAVATSAGDTRPGVLLLTAGARYKCNSQLLMDRRFHNVFGYALLDFSSWTGTYIRWTGSLVPEIGNGYGQNGSMEGQIVIKGSGYMADGAANASIGILFDSPTVLSCTHIRIVGITVYDVGISFQIGSRGYNQEFINCKSFSFGVCFDWIAADDNDERVSVFGGTFYNGGTFIRHKRPAGGLYVYSASIDYVSKLMTVVQGKVQWFGVHTESSNWVDGTIDVSGDAGSFIMMGGWFLQQQNLGNVTNYVKVGAGACVKFINVLTNNTSNIATPNATTPTTWATGAGRFEMHDCEPAFEYGGFPIRQHTDYSVLSDGGFERALGEDLLWINIDTTLGADRYTAQNLQLTRATANQLEGSGCLRLDKQFGTTSSGSIVLIAVPVRYGDKITTGFRVRTAPDRPGTNQTLIIRGGFAKLDGFGAGNRPNIARFSPPGEFNIVPATGGYSLVSPHNGLSQVVAPSWANHYIIVVDTVLAHQASWCFDGLWFNRW